MSLSEFPNSLSLSNFMQLFHQLPTDLRKIASDEMNKEVVQSQITVITNRLNIVEERQDIADNRQDSVEIRQFETEKRVIQINQREEEKTKYENCFAEASTIAGKMFPGENINKLMSAELIGIFYFGFGIYGKSRSPLSNHLAESAKKALDKNKYFYSKEQKVGKGKIVPYYPGNSEKILNLFNEKLADFGFKDEFYNAPDSEELLWIACHISAIRLNKEFDAKIDYKNLDKKDLNREVKKHLRLMKAEFKSENE